MNACPFSHFVAESVARIDKPNVETRYLRAAARAGDDKRRAINLYARNILLSIRAHGSFPYFPIAISPRQLIYAPLSLYKSGRACTGGRARDCIATRSDQTTRSSKNAKAKYANTAEAPPFHASFPSDRTQCDGPQETPYRVATDAHPAALASHPQRKRSRSYPAGTIRTADIRRKQAQTKSGEHQIGNEDRAEAEYRCWQPAIWVPSNSRYVQPQSFTDAAVRHRATAIIGGNELLAEPLLPQSLAP